MISKEFPHPRSTRPCLSLMAYLICAKILPDISLDQELDLLKEIKRMDFPNTSIDLFEQLAEKHSLCFLQTELSFLRKGEYYLYWTGRRNEFAFRRFFLWKNRDWSRGLIREYGVFRTLFFWQLFNFHFKVNSPSFRHCRFIVEFLAQKFYFVPNGFHLVWNAVKPFLTAH